MSTQKYPLLKHWLTTGSVAFVASCGCSLPFTQNLAHSGLFGLAAMPGVVASGIVLPIVRAYGQYTKILALNIIAIGKLELILWHDMNMRFAILKINGSIQA